jgi:hypothetical protein
MTELERELFAALKVAREWMPVQPMGPLGASDCALVDAAIAKARAADAALSATQGDKT